MDIFEMAAALGDALKQDEKLVALEAARKNYMEDRQLQALVIEYEVVLCQNSPMNAQALEKAQEEVNALMNKINGIITTHITGEEPGCTHNCATCGGCH